MTTVEQTSAGDGKVADKSAVLARQTDVTDDRR